MEENVKHGEGRERGICKRRVKEEKKKKKRGDMGGKRREGKWKKVKKG